MRALVLVPLGILALGLLGSSKARAQITKLDFIISDTAKALCSPEVKPAFYDELRRLTKNSDSSLADCKKSMKSGVVQIARIMEQMYKEQSKANVMFFHGIFSDTDFQKFSDKIDSRTGLLDFCLAHPWMDAWLDNYAKETLCKKPTKNLLLERMKYLLEEKDGKSCRDKVKEELELLKSLGTMAIIEKMTPVIMVLKQTKIFEGLSTKFDWISIAKNLAENIMKMSEQAAQGGEMFQIPGSECVCDCSGPETISRYHSVKEIWKFIHGFGSITAAFGVPNTVHVTVFNSNMTNEASGILFPFSVGTGRKDVNNFLNLNDANGTFSFGNNLASQHESLVVKLVSEDKTFIFLKGFILHGSSNGAISSIGDSEFEGGIPLKDKLLIFKSSKKMPNFDAAFRISGFFVDDRTKLLGIYFPSAESSSGSYFVVRVEMNTDVKFLENLSKTGKTSMLTYIGSAKMDGDDFYDLKWLKDSGSNVFEQLERHEEL